MSKLGVVVIGRNEGERLKRCLMSLSRSSALVVYVDSGSVDDSVVSAEKAGAVIVELDLTKPFTAARARNEGVARLQSLLPDVVYIQFVDGDCELDPEWLAAGVRFLDSHKNVGVVSGRLKERFPERSVYNFLCDIEWEAPDGESKACGGIALFRAQAFVAVHGFRTELIAGEEPELCYRLRTAGWKVWRIKRAMAWHDAAMTSFFQWWRRSVRGGYAYAEGAYLHGSSTERYAIRESMRIWFWGLGVPMASLFLFVLVGWGGLLLLLAYPVQVFRLAVRGARSASENLISSFFLVLGKFPELQGQFKFLWRKSIGARSRLIEYK